MVYISTFHKRSSCGASGTFCVIVMFYFLHKVSTSKGIVYYLFPHSRHQLLTKPHVCTTVVTESSVRLPSTYLFTAEQYSVKNWATCFGPGRPSSGCIYLLNYLLTPWCRVLLEQLTGLQLVKKFPHFTEPKGSLPHSQASATRPYHGPDQSSPYTHIPPPGDHS